ncbi:hypothetical protein DP113_17775 [Brasilonema octagenarum UFV-E1]|uniref:Uncharacterized protein n=1 Tax=Brasilonema sennae CENA114 TaxID=415709 RepID=A0A856MIN5_9CYAN|nr:hypothetical protein [Brasilonema sennae]QDL09511.1 hypothetical protein DP114_17840 [Brasilonema sennae CENA114]QDL15867.1 hypothetical protein DP113_17775 [Brasilonema octagenarum UFV-E1]
MITPNQLIYSDKLEAKNIYNVAILGAGPAGLASVAGLKNHNEVIIIEYGMHTHKRSHTNACHLGVGVGGAGLFSDGKFSYYPAGTAVYQLSKKNVITEAHQWVEGIMAKYGIESSTIADMKFEKQDFTSKIMEKKYPSFYASLQQRKNLMLDIADIKNKAHLLTDTKVLEIDKLGSVYIIKTQDVRTGIVDTVKAKKIIIATGRFGTKELKNMLENNIKLPFRYLRTEFGIRLESSSDIGFLSRKDNPDVKFIWRNKFGEVRTFCTCRNGEIWSIPYQNDLSALSGRSDGPKSGFSNFGLLVRINSDTELGKSVMEKVINNDAIKNQESIVQSLHSFLGRNIQDTIDEYKDFKDIVAERPWFPKNKFKKGNIRKLLGKECSELLTIAINHLLDMSPDMDRKDVPRSHIGYSECKKNQRRAAVVADTSQRKMREAQPTLINRYGCFCTMTRISSSRI